MDRLTFNRLRYRAWHRGTREADMMIGGFCDRYAQHWTAEQQAWFERLMDEQDVDIMGWAMGTIPVPAAFEGPMMDALRRLDFLILSGHADFTN